MVSREPPDLNVFAQSRDGVVDNLGDFFIGIFDERLLQQTHFRVKSLNFPVNNFIDYFLRFSGFESLLR
jgi:hypothetical protein